MSGVSWLLGFVTTMADLEIFTQRYSADPSPYVANGRLYITTTHDLAANTEWAMKDYNCLSTEDGVNWRDEGLCGKPLIFRVFIFPRSWYNRVTSRIFDVTLL